MGPLLLSRFRSWGDAMEVATIYVSDVEELCDLVDPWQYRMSQLSLGDFHGDMRIAKVADLFVSEE